MSFTRQQKAILLIAFFVFILDRFAKVSALKLWSNKPLEIFPWLQLKLSINHQIAFSLPLSGPLLYLILLISFLLLSYYCLFFFKQRQTWPGLLVIILLVGALSNASDRLLYGGVLDYIQLKHFSSFNLADSLICLSALSLIVFLAKTKQH